MTYIGIDVSKDTFVVAYSPDKNSKTKTFKNTTKGIHEFIRLSPRRSTIASWKRQEITVLCLSICFQRQV